MKTESISPARSEIADLLTAAVAEATGLEPQQIIAINADGEQIRITYKGAKPGLMGGEGRIAMQLWNTQTGRLTDEQVVK